MGKSILSLLVILIGVDSSFASTNSFIENNVAWRKRGLTVCIADTLKELNARTIPKASRADLERKFGSMLVPLDEESLQIIRTITETEYTAERTGIHFTGWQRCSVTNSPDVVIATVSGDTEKVFAGISSHIGRVETNRTAIDGPKIDDLSRKHEPVSVAFNLRISEKVIDVHDRLRFIVLHELGHVAGLRHEHARFEAWNDANCKTTKLFEKAGTRELGSFGFASQLVGSYDSNSIMNYCYDTLLRTIGTEFLLKTPSCRDTESSPDPELTVVHPSRVSFTDATLAQYERVNDSFQKVRIRIGLSAGDVHALRCLYFADQETGCEAQKSEL